MRRKSNTWAGRLWAVLTMAAVAGVGTMPALAQEDEAQHDAEQRYLEAIGRSDDGSSEQASPAEEQAPAEAEEAAPAEVAEPAEPEPVVETSIDVEGLWVEQAQPEPEPAVVEEPVVAEEPVAAPAEGVEAAQATEPVVAEPEPVIIEEDPQPEPVVQLPGDEVEAEITAAEPLPPEPVEADGLAYPVGAVQVVYGTDHPEQISHESMMYTRVRLGVTDAGFVAPRPNLPSTIVGLNEIAELEETTFYASAIRQISQALTRRYHDRGIVGVYAVVSHDQVNPRTGEDLRAAGEDELYFVIVAGQVEEVRTLASGQRFEGVEERRNLPAHERIREHMPVEEGDLVQKAEISRYIHWLNRHPGRRVDVSTLPADDGGAVLDFLVTENRPQTLYATVSNNGTESTDEWRQAIGYYNTQFTGNDDIFSIGYTTTSLDEVHAISSSYEAPLPGSERTRWRVLGSYNTYDASTVGLGGVDFEGQAYQIGGDMIWNIHQDDTLFVDLVAGLTFHRTEVDNETIASAGRGQFLLPHVGLLLENRRLYSNTVASIDLEGNVLSNDDDKLARLGRFDPDELFAVLNFSASHSTYLERVFDRAAWENPNTPESSTLAHELYAQIRGQTAFTGRLVPQYQMVVGGMNSVRGYPESAMAGDDGVSGTLEYRYHVPRAFAIEEEAGKFFGKPFRWAPQQVYGIPDWDLILRGFVDAAYVTVNEDAVFEQGESLIGAGVGAGLRFSRNLSVDVDWGFALKELPADDVDSGDSEIHFTATVLY